MAAAAFQTLGDRALAVTGRSPSLAATELEAAVAPLPPVIDVAAMTTGLSLDLCLGSVVVASDTALAPLTVVGDGLVWMGDAVYPGKVTLE